MSELKGYERKHAVAIKYEQQNNDAPVVVAKGYGIIAENIVAAAQKHSVPVYQNKVLAGMLMAVDIDSQIPPELYQAVAEVLAYVYRLDQSLRKR